ncbi:phosphoribosylglycinamide formyltransferase, partial [Streptomyces griseus]|nr:phosphoribosylglycinamide formyltransferase [Streptomyces griseus]
MDGSLSPDATSRSRPRPVGAVGCAGIVADGRPVRRVPRIGRSDAFVRPYKEHAAPASSCGHHVRKGPDVA